MISSIARTKFQEMKLNIYFQNPLKCIQNRSCLKALVMINTIMKTELNLMFKRYKKLKNGSKMKARARDSVPRDLCDRNPLPMQSNSM